MKKRIIMLATVALVMAAMLVVSAMPAFAYANPESNGKVTPSSSSNCVDNLNKQGEKDGVISTNCDHDKQF